jgi:hypothetical protein
MPIVPYYLGRPAQVWIKAMSPGKVAPGNPGGEPDPVLDHPEEFRKLCGAAEGRETDEFAAGQLRAS